MDKHELEKIDKQINRALFIERYGARIKKWGIIGSLGVVALIVGVVIYNAVKPEVECVIDDQCQLGYYCSEGSCILEPGEEPPEDLEMEVTGVFVVPNGDHAYDLAAEIRNPSSEWGLEKFQYSFQFIDQSGDDEKQTTIDGISYILPRDEKQVVRLNVPYKGDYTDVIFSLEPITWKKIPGFSDLNIEIKGKTHQKITDGTGIYRADVVLNNLSNYDFERVDVVVLLLDANDRVVGINSTNINAFLKGSQREVGLKWYNPLAGVPVTVVAYVMTDMYSPGNFINRYELDGDSYFSGLEDSASSETLRNQ